MINDHRLFSNALVADILTHFLLYIILANFEKMILRSYGVNLIYYMNRYLDLEAQSQCLIPATTDEQVVAGAHSALPQPGKSSTSASSSATTVMLRTLLARDPSTRI